MVQDFFHQQYHVHMPRCVNWCENHLSVFWVQGIQILLPTIPLGREAPEPQNWSSKQSWLSGRALVNLLVWSSTKVHSTYPKEFQPKPISVAITRASKRNIISTQNPSWFKRSIFREIFRCGACKSGRNMWVTNHSTIHLPIGTGISLPTFSLFFMVFM